MRWSSGTAGSCWCTLTGLTGIDDPYEPPARAEAVIDTSVTPLAGSVARIRGAMNEESSPVG
ncbi:hypothetical protein E4P41_05815 [Geodermatophilus sp. DF01-2]|uniref:hypothetical protein n=1 Tax=Geodermatophilus sp. DF01-2 TaxID=2559610 RepID=UPI001074506A|nr:hypothetical protein [Geodermatophilus sp. DF01_2]TFV63029.1 hypothetical protein E4P41_05815 [Geodermatophilus sp. DF01_2]